MAESVELPDKCVCFVDDVSIPVICYNIDENSNRIYVRRYQDLTDTKTDSIVPIEVNNQTTDTLTDAVQYALNIACGGGVFTVTYDSRKLKITITP